MTNNHLARIVALALLVLAGSSRPLWAQVDLSGSWAARNHEDALERGPGPFAVDYTGLPLNDEGRAKALTYSASQYALIERQCGLWPPFYTLVGPQGMRIWEDSEMVNGTTVSLTIGGIEDRAPITIWMDGRPQPSDMAVYEHGAFTTGTWEGDVLVTHTTHMKAGSIRRNGAPNSDRASMTMYFIRHGDTLTVLGTIEDPVYLTEPFVLTKNYQLVTAPAIAPIGPPCVPSDQGAAGNGKIPHYAPDKNPFVDELTEAYHIPREATLGGAETMYPEFRKKIKAKFVSAEKCTQNCGGPAAPPAPPPPAVPAR